MLTVIKYFLSAKINLFGIIDIIWKKSVLLYQELGTIIQI